jgi:RNA polymerase sigma factor (sigma-70 family)
MSQAMLGPLSIRRLPGAAAEETAAATCDSWYEAYGSQLYGYLRFHVPSPDVAEDLTAEVFLRAVRSHHRFNPSLGSPRAWLFRIARNALRDHQRQSRRRRLVSIAGMRDLSCDAPSPEERLLWEEEVGRLLAALAELSSKDREIIGLCYGSDMSVAEAGEVLGLRATAARTRLWRALGRLRKALSS